MKLNKSIISVAILATTLSLVACHDDKTQTASSNSTQPTKNAMSKVEMANTPKTTSSVQQEKEALTQFNKTVQIIPVSYILSENEENKEILSYNYNIVNKGQENIKSVKWYSLVTFNKNLIDIFPISVTLKKPLPPHSQISVTFNKPLTSYPGVIQKEFLSNKKLQLNLTTVAGGIDFDNGKSIIVTTDQAVVASFKNITAPTEQQKAK